MANLEASDARMRRRWSVLLIGTAAVATAACGAVFRSEAASDTDAGGIDAGVDARPSIPDDDAGFVIVPPQKMPDSGIDAGEDAACTPGVRRCSPDNGGVEICMDAGWGDPATCADASVCANGACIAPLPDGAAPTPTSCLAGGFGVSNCGDNTYRIESCCTSFEVAGGTFDRTYAPDPDSGVATDKADPASVTGFRLDKYEVTVGRFRKFVSSVYPPGGGTGWTPPAGSGKHTHLNGGKGLSGVGTDGGVAYEPGWLSSNNALIAPISANLVNGCDYPYGATWADYRSMDIPYDHLPINCVNWWEAYAFCIWDDGFLPSAAEWGYAAAGGNEDREYPWGTTTPEGGSAWYYDIYDCNYDTVPSPGTRCDAFYSSIAAVGYTSLGAARWNQLDLTGNMREWDLDVAGSYVSPCVNCANFVTPPPGTAYQMAIAGGSFEDPLFAGVPITSSPPSFRTDKNGFRCARVP